jgi:hypothetical protein
MYTAELLVPEPCAFEFEMANDKLKRHKSSGIDQIAAELIKAGGRTIHFEIHKLINPISNQEELPEEWKESIIVFIRRVIKLIVVIIQAYHLSTTYTILSKILL